MTAGIIDTHVHVWDLGKAAYPWLDGDTSILNQTWSIDQIAEQRKEAGVEQGILVQASGNFEDTNWMLGVAEQTDWITGVVGWLPLLEPGTTQVLLENIYGTESYYKGVRHQVHDEQDTSWLLQEEVLESLAILSEHNIPFDVVAVLPAHLEAAITVAEKIPALRMMLDHLSQPPIASGEQFGRWGELMKIAAQHPNFYAKISGLGTASGNFTNRTADDIKPYVAFALEHFGAARCCCGGDWPVSMLADSYVNTWLMYKKILGGLLSEARQEEVLRATAKSFYGLD